MGTTTEGAILSRSWLGALRTLCALSETMREGTRLMTGVHPEAMPPASVGQSVRCYALAADDLDRCLRAIEADLGPLDGISDETAAAIADLAAESGTATPTFRSCRAGD